MEIKILERDQIFGNNRLEIFEKRGTKAAISDYAICCGGFVTDIYHAGKNKLENRTGWYWTKTDDGYNDARAVSFDGFDYSSFVDSRSGGVRPALPFSAISNICTNKVVAQDGLLEVEYGEYPQKAVSKQFQEELERLFQRGRLSKTGKYYTRDSVKYNKYNNKFQKEIQEEYEYNGKKYVRVRVNSCCDGKKFKLSNGEEYQDGDYVWIEISPIKWLVDKENDIAVAEKILFAGIQFKNKRDYKGDFEKNDLCHYMNRYFSKEMESMTRINTNNQEEKSKYQMTIDELQQELLEFMNLMPNDLKIKVQNRYNQIIDEYDQNRLQEKEYLFRKQSFFGKTDSYTTLLIRLLSLRSEIVLNYDAILKLKKIVEYRNLLNDSNLEKVEDQIGRLIQEIKKKIQDIYCVYKDEIKNRVENFFSQTEDNYHRLLKISFEDKSSMEFYSTPNLMKVLQNHLSNLLKILENPDLRKIAELKVALNQESIDPNINSLVDNIKTMNYVMKKNTNELRKKEWSTLKEDYGNSFDSIMVAFIQEQKEKKEPNELMNKLRNDLREFVDKVITSIGFDTYQLEKITEVKRAHEVSRTTVSTQLYLEIQAIASQVTDLEEIYNLEEIYISKVTRRVIELKKAGNEDIINTIMKEFYKDLTSIWADIYEIYSYQKSEVKLERIL